MPPDALDAAVICDDGSRLATRDVAAAAAAAVVVVEEGNSESADRPLVLSAALLPPAAPVLSPALLVRVAVLVFNMSASYDDPGRLPARVPLPLPVPGPVRVEAKAEAEAEVGEDSPDPDGSCGRRRDEPRPSVPAELVRSSNEPSPSRSSSSSSPSSSSYSSPATCVSDLKLLPPAWPAVVAGNRPRDLDAAALSDLADVAESPPPPMPLPPPPTLDGSTMARDDERRREFGFAASSPS